MFANLAPDWAAALDPMRQQLSALGQFLREEVQAGRGYLPDGPRILRAFTRPMSEVKVLIVGQDPYPTPGHPTGLAFSVEQQVRPLPGSLRNIFTEYMNDTGFPRPKCGDLSPWHERGVLLLNRTLTVSPGAPGSHRNRGWEAFTAHAITELARQQKLVAILWGKDAAGVSPLLGDNPTITSAHPSPLSASRGFLGSRPFSRANQLLEDLGIAPIHWELES